VVTLEGVCSPCISIDNMRRLLSQARCTISITSGFIVKPNTVLTGPTPKTTRRRVISPHGILSPAQPFHLASRTIYACNLYLASSEVFAHKIYQSIALILPYHFSKMSYKKSTGSLWERPMSGITPERDGPLSTTDSMGQKDGDWSRPSGNHGYGTGSESASIKGAREADTQRHLERETQRSSCRCPASRPRNGCKNCKIRTTGSTTGVFGVLKKGRDKYKKQMRAAEVQAQSGTRTRNPEGHVRPS
jgi:hypothetical protein